MRLLLRALGNFNQWAERLVNILSLMLLSAFIAFIVYQVLSRSFAFVPTLFWTEELSRFAFQWMVFLGTATAVLHADHFVLEAFARGSRLDRATRVIRDVACLIVGVIFVVYGKDFAASGLNRTAMASGLSMIYVYSSFLVCGALSISFSVQRLLSVALHGVEATEAHLAQPADIESAGHNDSVERTTVASGNRGES